MTDVVIRLTGEFDISNAQAILEAVSKARQGRADAHVVVDLRDVTFIDAAGIRALLRAQQQAQQGGGGLVVRGPSPLVLDMLTVLGLAEQLTWGSGAFQERSAAW